MRLFAGPLSILTLYPLCWAIASFMFFSKNGSPHLLMSGIVATTLGALLLIADVILVLAVKRLNHG